MNPWQFDAAFPLWQDGQLPGNHGDSGVFQGSEESTGNDDTGVLYVEVGHARHPNRDPIKNTLNTTIDRFEDKLSAMFCMFL